MGKGIFALILITLFTACLPKPAHYPYKPAADILSEANHISSRLSNYIDGWISGMNSFQIPDSLIPSGIDTSLNRHFFLQKYDEIHPEYQWVVRKSSTVDLMDIREGLFDPHATYLFLASALAPFGDELIIEGEFPYSRFFSIQLSAPIGGKTFCVAGKYGAAELSIADVDIPVLAGNENPFVKGGNRFAANRKYQVKFEMAKGDPTILNPSFAPPYLMKQEKLFASFIQYQGPWWKTFGGKGPWNMGSLCLRYYATDKDKGNMGGVPLPKAYYIHKNGVKYFIQSDYTGFERKMQKGLAARSPISGEPGKAMGANTGWFKSFGFMQSIGEGILFYNYLGYKKTKHYIEDIEKTACGRGINMEGAGKYEASAGLNNYTSYLHRMMKVQKKNVFILKGKLPSFPRSRNSEKTMDSASLRYFSITTYDVRIKKSFETYALSSLMDDEFLTDTSGNYTLVYSRLKDRPSNANINNGINWVEWGPGNRALLLIRMLRVAPDWISSSKDEALDRDKAAYLSDSYDVNLIGKNPQEGNSGKYLPSLHYMSKKDFESLGKDAGKNPLPDWRIYR